VREKREKEKEGGTRPGGQATRDGGAAGGRPEAAVVSPVEREGEYREKGDVSERES